MELTAIAKEDLESKGLLLKNKIELQAIINAIPDVYMNHIGRKDVETNKLESFFVVDVENGNTKEFDKVIANIEVIEKVHTIFKIDTAEEKRVVDYFVPYIVQESSMHKPTITECHVENGYPTSGHYECEYEILLTCDDATRRIVIPYSSVNIPMLGFLSDIEDDVRYVLNGEYDEDNPFANIIHVNDEEDWGTVIMFDDFGRTCDIEIDSPSDFVSMIVSVRQIKCEFVDS